MAVEMNLIRCQGRTPEATMASALYTDIKRKLFKSAFTRCPSALPFRDLLTLTRCPFRDLVTTTVVRFCSSS
jgi:HB1, ASXL, restriction endonuclease HTH domain